MRSITTTELRSVRLEDVLESVLLTMRRPAFAPEEARPTVMRIVHQLALRDLA